MSEQNVEKVIDTLAQYGAPMLNLCTVIAAVGALVCLIFFVVIFAIVIKGFRDMDKEWDDFKRR